MNFELSEEHLMIRQAARDFAQNEKNKKVLLNVTQNANIQRNMSKEWLSWGFLE